MQMNNTVPFLPRISQFLLDGQPLAVSDTMLEHYRLTDASDTSEDPENGVYTFIFREPVTCTVSVAFLDENGNTDSTPNIGNSFYYIVARRNETNIGAAHITGNDNNISFRNGNSDVSIENDIHFVVVKSDSELTNEQLINQIRGITILEDGDFIGEYYALSVPTNLTGTVYEFTATKQHENTYEMQYRNAAGETVAVELGNSYYYILCDSVEDENVKFYATLPSYDAPLTFIDRDGNGHNAIPEAEWTVLKTTSPIQNLDELIANGELELMQISLLLRQNRYLKTRW